MKYEAGMSTKESPPEYQLVDAVSRMNHDAIEKLLIDAGGACQARDLVKKAEFESRSSQGITHTIAIDGAKETLTVSKWTRDSFLPLVSLTQKKCER